MTIVLVVLLLMAVIGVFPIWPHSRRWGYYPSGGVTLLAAILIVLLLVHGI